MPKGLLAFTQLGGNPCWEWGIWAYENGVPDRFDIRPIDPIRPSDMQAIYDNNLSFHLVSIPGSEISHGVLKHDGRARPVSRVPGSPGLIEVFLNHYLAGSVWKGTFVMGNEFGDRVELIVNRGNVRPNGTIGIPTEGVKSLTVWPAGAPVPYVKEHVIGGISNGHLNRGGRLLPVRGINGSASINLLNEANGPAEFQMIFGAKLKDSYSPPPPPTDGF